jgi:hypothetical protein
MFYSRCQLRQVTLLWLAVLLLMATGSSQQAGSALRKRLFVNGRLVPTNRVVSKEGIDYVDASFLAEALGASVQLGGGGVMIRSAVKNDDCNKVVVEGQRFSEQFRTDVARVADEIESLRAVVLKREKVDVGTRFDEIDGELSLAKTHVQTDADSAVYYALSYANNSLAIAYFKQQRGVPVKEAQKGQMDSMLCAMESKFALMKGVLLPGGSCSVFQRIEAQTPQK